MTTNEQLIRAVQRATRTLAKSGQFDSLLRDVLTICVDAVGAYGGTIYLHDPANRTLRFQHVLPESVLDKLPMRDIPDNYGMAGQAFQERRTLVRTFEPDPRHERTKFEEATGVVLRSMISVPLMLEDEEPIGVVQMLNKQEGEFNENDVSVMDTVAAVCTMAFLNSRLTEEATRSSSLLGMGKVSHDIGNLAASLYATVSFAEFATDQLHQACEVRDEVSVKAHAHSLDEGLSEIKQSVNRIVGYSRLISDLSAGRALRPDFQLKPMRSTIQTSAAYLESEARNNGIELCYELKDAPPTYHDELYVGRIVLNLVGNAIKAVKETAEPPAEDETIGRVTVGYGFSDDVHTIWVRDSGPGMPEDIVRRILAGNARSQWDKGSGSGWGTKIVLELTTSHHGELDIQSAPGQGTTFLVRIPHRTTPEVGT